MSTLHGHRAVFDILAAHLPPATLLYGPASVGKWTLAQLLAETHTTTPADRMSWPEGLRIGNTRTLIDFASTGPFGPLKVICVRLDNSSTAALHALLKVLEEPPRPVRFLLTSAGTTLSTVASRCHVYRLRRLRPEEIRPILIEKGLSPAVANRLAGAGHGQVTPALAAARTPEAARSAVLAIVAALARRDRTAFNTAFTAFDDGARSLLEVWFHEAVTGQYRVFTEPETFGLAADPGRLHQMLTALTRLSGTAARLGVRVALTPFLTYP